MPMSAFLLLTGKKLVIWATPGTSAGRAGMVGVAGVAAIDGAALSGEPGATAVGGGGLAGGGGDRVTTPLQEATTLCKR